MAGEKKDIGKLRIDLTPPEVEEALAKILGFGAEKYGDENWKDGIEYKRIYGAIRRHLLAWRKGEILDDESNMPHLWHAFTELAFLIYYEEHYDKYWKFNNYEKEMRPNFS